MLLLAIILQNVGIYALYNTSLRADIHHLPGRKWLQEHSLLSKLTGCVLLMLSLFCSTIALGVGTGILSALLIMMTIFSIVIILFPLKSV